MSASRVRDESVVALARSHPDLKEIDVSYTPVSASDAGTSSVFSVNPSKCSFNLMYHTSLKGGDSASASTHFRNPDLHPDVKEIQFSYNMYILYVLLLLTRALSSP